MQVIQQVTGRMWPCVPGNEDTLGSVDVVFLGVTYTLISISYILFIVYNQRYWAVSNAEYSTFDVGFRNAYFCDISEIGSRVNNMLLLEPSFWFTVFCCCVCVCTCTCVWARVLVCVCVCSLWSRIRYCGWPPRMYVAELLWVRACVRTITRNKLIVSTSDVTFIKYAPWCNYNAKRTHLT